MLPMPVHNKRRWWRN